MEDVEGLSGQAPLHPDQWSLIAGNTGNRRALLPDHGGTMIPPSVSFDLQSSFPHESV
jgi:hypothetical protein